jgi:hypothetical protein
VPVPARVKLVLPWLVAIVVLGWLFTTVPGDALVGALRRVPLRLYLVLVVAHATATLLADGLACLITIRYALGARVLRYLDAVTIRGATYLLGLVNYGVGQGGIAYFLNQRHGVPLPEAFGVVLLMAGINVSLVAAAAAAGLIFGGAPAQPALRAVVLTLACVFPAYLVVLAWRPGWLARIRLLRPLFDAGLKGNLMGLLARTPHVVVLLTGHFLAMRLFGVRPTPAQTLTLLPLVFFVAVVPVSPFGLGTAQATAVALLSPLAAFPREDDRQAAVLAYSLSYQALGMIVQALLGVSFLRRLTRPSSVETGPAP